MFLINILVPVMAGIVYFIMAAEIKRVSHFRKIIFGEIGYKKVFNAFLMLGIYFITRPLQNTIGPHPWPLIINDLRQFFLMAIISPSILVGILHWVPSEKGTPKTVEYAAYLVGLLMAVVFILINSIGISGSKVIASLWGMNIYDATWFSSGTRRMELVMIHLIAQSISPVGYFLLSAGYVRHRRYNYPLSNVYNLMPKKWKYLEIGLLIFALSFVVAGFAAFFGQYYTYLWVIYFTGATVAGVFETIAVKIPPREAPADLKK
ncbi:MAG: hypothetical protein ABII64_07735 [Elusimicrobiota bacterium]